MAETATAKTITYKIYQIRLYEEKAHNLIFRPICELPDGASAITKDLYDLVYTGTLANNGNLCTANILETLYEMFNLAPPADYKGRSMSVSDVVVLNQDGQEQAYYVDSFGFKETPGFLNT